MTANADCWDEVFAILADAVDDVMAVSDEHPDGIDVWGEVLTGLHMIINAGQWQHVAVAGRDPVNPEAEALRRAQVAGRC